MLSDLIIESISFFIILSKKHPEEQGHHHNAEYHWYDSLNTSLPVCLLLCHKGSSWCDSQFCMVRRKTHIE